MVLMIEDKPTMILKGYFGWPYNDSKLSSAAQLFDCLRYSSLQFGANSAGDMWLLYGFEYNFLMDQPVMRLWYIVVDYSYGFAHMFRDQLLYMVAAWYTAFLLVKGQQI